MADGASSQSSPPSARDRAAGHRHGVHGRGPLPRRCCASSRSRVERDDGVRGRGPGPAREDSTPRRSPSCWPTRPSRSSCTPAARTSRCCAGLGHRGHEHLRHAGRRRLRRAARAARLRGAAARDARRAAAQERELHPLGRAAAQRRSRSTTPARTCCTCSQLADALQGACATAAAWGGRARSAASLEAVSDERDLDTIFAAAAARELARPGQRAVARELVRWREETARERGPPVLQRPRGRGAGGDRQAPPAASSAWRRSAASTRARCAGAARSSRPSSAGASATGSRPTGTAPRPPTPRTRR